MTCIDECVGQHFHTSYVLQSDPTLTVDMCRPLSYYVNPDSEQMLELGTIEYPFKDINLVLVELQNQHQHTDRVIDIYVIEETDNYMTVDLMKIVNITQVIIDTYTDHSSDDPKHANLRLTENIGEIRTVKSLLNIIQNTTLNEIDTSRMSEHEIIELTQQSFVIFHVHSSSLTFNHIDVHSEFELSNIEVVFVYTSYCFHKTQGFYNMYLDVKGQGYRNTYASVNVHSENITLNMTQSAGGFFYESACNFEGDLNLANHLYKNIYTFTDSDNPLKTGAIVINGNSNFTVSNITIQVTIHSSLQQVVLGSLGDPR